MKKGLIKFLAHRTDMKIPIANSIFKNKLSINKDNHQLSKLNNLQFIKPNKNKFLSLKILKIIPNKISLFETVIIAANDELVNYYLKGKIKFTDINKNLLKVINLKEFDKYKHIKPRNFEQIYKLITLVRLKTIRLCIK